MVEQYQPPAAGVSRYRKVLRDFKANLIRIGTGTTLALCRGNASAVEDKSGIGGWSEGAFRPGQSLHQIVEALKRKPKLEFPRYVFRSRQ
jgi:hypothetical protein